MVSNNESDIIIQELLKNAEVAAEGTNIASRIHSEEVPKLLLHKNKVVGVKTINGIEIKTEETKSGVKAEVRVLKNHKIKEPIYMCFGVLEENYEQHIDLKFIIEENSEVKVYAFCTFPRSIKVVHKMIAEYELKKNSKFSYNEFHYHGQKGALVDSRTTAKLDDNAKLSTSFTLLHGTVGDLFYYINSELKNKARFVAVAKIKSKDKDEVVVDENAKLLGKESAAILKSRLAVSDDARAKFTGEIVGIGDDSRGHVDCKEILIDNGRAETIPKLVVINKKSRLTHEAAIGSVDKKELQTLEARGLTREEAINLIVRGMLE